jgi:NAD(P)-dependent dehydrogenase (short-subunit alcohol dehydrogenase family)
MKDKVVVITGASKGLGKGLAQLLASKGNKVIICARRKDEVEETAKEIGALAFVADVTKEDDIKALAAFVLKSFGRIDIWINNAGVWVPHAPIEEMDLTRMHTMFEINVFGTMYGSKAALLQMRRQEEGGVLVNILSTSALNGRPTSSGYAASKWAARGFTESIREEYKGTNIKVIGVYPGGMQTNLFDEEKPSHIAEYMTYESVAQKIVENLELEHPQDDLIIQRPGK